MTSQVSAAGNGRRYRRTMTEMTVRAGVGPLLRDWRQRRRRSQLDLALDAGVSARHLSFVETGRSNPSPEVVLALAEELEVPLRDRNHLLLAAGYAPRFGERALDDPEMTPVRQALDLVLGGHEPYPAAVVDRWWEMVAANSGIALLTEGVAPELLEPPVNVIRVALHPDGMARRIVNFGVWRAHMLERLRHQVTVTGDGALRALYDEVSAYPGPSESHGGDAGIFVPLVLRAGDRELRFFSTLATFGTAVDITVAELAIESFFPADAATAEALQKRSA
jgi:transcriptional regulator with XRE-family HTH domain